MARIFCILFYYNQFTACFKPFIVSKVRCILPLKWTRSNWKSDKINKNYFNTRKSFNSTIAYANELVIHMRSGSNKTNRPVTPNAYILSMRWSCLAPPSVWTVYITKNEQYVSNSITCQVVTNATDIHRQILIKICMQIIHSQVYGQ